MPQEFHKINMPRIQKVILSNFSLYTKKRIIAIDFNEGVFCLAGANGLGKSTFLAAVNYGITGIVADPQEKFSFVSNYFKNNRGFAQNYFNGRVDEKDRDKAEVTLEIKLGDYSYKLTRPLFETEELSELVIYNNANETPELVLDGLDMTAGERHITYKNHLVEQMGLNSFEQFVFLQYFVFTFDERRHLLFWDEKALDQTLYLAFGVDPVDAKKADDLRKEIDKADSRARNAQWQASELRKKVEELQQLVDTGTQNNDVADDIIEQHQQLMLDHDNNAKAVARLENEIRDANRRLIALSAQQATLRSEYTSEFSRRFHKQGFVAHHPLVVSSIIEGKCGICGTEAPSVAISIQDKINNNLCPLCSSTVATEEPGETAIALLRSLDERLTFTQDELEQTLMSIERINLELDATKLKYRGTQFHLDQFEQTNNEFLTNLRVRTNSDDRVTTQITSYLTNIEGLKQERQEQYELRDRKRKERNVLQSKIEKSYSDVEADFVPLFRNLAILFLGIELSVQLEKVAPMGIRLVLDIDSKARRDSYQLSESQKFFVDIALRMALAQYMSDPRSKASLFIDTPEGSLDIAYESRAGKMFARFVNSGYNIVMTANINTSHLILQLAEQCGQARMVLCPMETWTDLSEVQLAEHKLFVEAYQNIEMRLKHA